jgi:hypothetical protein
VCMFWKWANMVLEYCMGKIESALHFVNIGFTITTKLGPKAG